MGRVTSRTTFGLQRCVFVGKGALLISVTLDAGGISPGGQPGLFEFKTAMRIVAVAAAHSAFKNFMMKRLIECMLDFAMTPETELRVAGLQHGCRSKPGLFSVHRTDTGNRAGQVFSSGWRVGGVTIGTTDVVAPMFPAPEIVVLFSSGMAGQTSFGNLLRRLVLERDDLFGIAFFSVSLAGTMTRFATCHLPFPTANC